MVEEIEYNIINYLIFFMSIYDIKNLINSWLYYLETDSLDPNTRELLIRRLLEVGISPFSSTSMNFSYMEPLNSSVLHVFDKNNNLKGVKIAPDIGSDFNIIDIKFVENPLASGWRMGGGATAPCNTKQSGDGPSTPIYSGGGAEAGSCLAASPPRRLAASPPRRHGSAPTHLYYSTTYFNTFTSIL